jgi:hypothetical protein
METFVLRVWLPDRPGALGQVASRIGAVRGSVVGIDILEQGAGKAVDELVVSLPEPHLVDLLVAEVSQVDGVDVEDIRPIIGARHDPGLFALAIAARLVEAGAAPDVLSVLAHDAVREFDCTWASIVDLPRLVAIESIGDAPPAAWVAAFVEGSSHLNGSSHDDVGPQDLAWARLERAGLAVAVGRKGRSFRWRERRQLTALARIADGLLGREARASETGVGRPGP